MAWIRFSPPFLVQGQQRDQGGQSPLIGATDYRHYLAG